ncbi:MAG: ribonuclease Y [Oscillospiraceae bacterium]|nr:ribonuclease Y [Oscillospiraceae bacterium]
MNENLIIILVGIGAAFAFGVAGFFFGIAHRRRVAEARIGSAEDEAKRILNSSIKSAEQRRKEVVLEAKDEIFRMRTESENELKERRNELSKRETRITQREESLDKKQEQLERDSQSIIDRRKNLDERAESIEQLKKEVEEIKQSEQAVLESVSNLTQSQAKEILLAQVDNDLDHEKAIRIKAYEQNLHDESELLAQDIISTAIARTAADHSSEVTVSVVSLPNDDMKGRIIGREGRNIRAIETITGVDLIIDDTPEAITVSCFDPIRREVARRSIEKLISDGRIHPARIEETVEKSRKEVDQTIRREGERVVLDLGIHGIHPDLVKILGRLHYRTSYGQNVLNHSFEVAVLSGIIAAELNLDVKMARRAGLLHDIGKALDHEIEGSHVQIGVDIAKRYKENTEIVHAIEAHHGDVDATTPLAYIIMAADAISAARPGARSENLENYIKRLEKLEEIANGFDGVDHSFAVQAGREIRILVSPDVVSDDRLAIVARDIVKRIEDELNYPGQIKVNVIRESRAIEYAK